MDLAVGYSGALSATDAVAPAEGRAFEHRRELSAAPPVAPDLSAAWTVLRARQWAHFVLVPAIPLTALVLRDPLAAARAYLPAAAAASLCLGYAYGLNAIADRHDDVRPSKNPLVRVKRVPLAVKTAVAACAIVALSFAGITPHIRLFPVIVSIFWASLYSVGPRLKRLPLLSTAINCGIFAPLAFLIRDRLQAPDFGLLTLTFVTVQTQAQLIHEVADRDEDLHASVRSTAVAWGGPTTLRAATWLGLGVGAALLLAGTWTATRLLAVVTVSAAAAVLHGGLPANASVLRRRHRRLALFLGSILFLAAALGS